jgi:hypothetical protein
MRIRLDTTAARSVIVDRNDGAPLGKARPQHQRILVTFDFPYTGFRDLWSARQRTECVAGRAHNLYWL